jgi:sulfoxide reductase heme-binding subunit YedZ
MGTRADPARGAPPAVQDTREGAGRRHQNRAPRIKNPRWLHPLVIVASLIPFVWVAWAMWSDVFQGTRYLGSEPIKESEHFTGKWALRFLLATLAVTPAIRLTGLGWLVKYRRTFGLVAFFYACVHLSIYFGLDIELMWDNLVEDVLDRTYITLGMTALLLLVPLALTSTKASIRWLGNRKWNALHRLVYVSAVLGCIHFYMAVKRDVREPLVFAAILAVLLGYRIGASRAARRIAGGAAAATGGGPG